MDINPWSRHLGPINYGLKAELDHKAAHKILVTRDEVVTYLQNQAQDMINESRVIQERAMEIVTALKNEKEGK